MLGDIMLDEYIIGKVSRISPEAPVPIVEVEEEYSLLGGASNVANNIKSLLGEPILFGVIGRDKGGEKIINLLQEKGIISKLYMDRNRLTTQKTRIIALNQQVVRVDREVKDFISEEIEEIIFQNIEDYVNEIDIFVLSDYAKGVLTPKLTAEVITLIKSKGKKVIVDPKGRDYKKYKGANLITPNEKEAQMAINAEENFDLFSCAKKLWEITKGEGILITRGDKGMFLFEPESQTFIPALSSQVRDVTGAGDTVVATLSLALVGGGSLLESALLSNFSASITVRKLGTATVTPKELNSIIPESIELRDGWIFFKKDKE
ncbi:MAG: D-glycero-beta-D-manno-heptose-7-phosphate kinase [Dictyoglomaceae bacterium]|nr:D-glycero-beta-D-manno-heptose-7-phosphate kinase [Dictyoglomaceae bacterium]